jgi:hypothetical protein
LSIEHQADFRDCPASFASSEAENRSRFGATSAVTFVVAGCPTFLQQIDNTYHNNPDSGVTNANGATQ